MQTNTSLAFSKHRASTSQADFYRAARANMIESQLQPNKVVDEALLGAMATLPREAFVAEEQKPFAYADEDVSVGFARKLLAPLTLARLIQALAIKPSYRVLDIGANTGYAAAILNELAGETVALESDPALLRLLQKNKQALGLEQVAAMQGTLCDGFAPASPYQAILIEGGTEWLPEKIINQLAEKGRLACVHYKTGDLNRHFGTARVYEKINGALVPHDLFEVAAPILPSLHARPGFEF